MSDWLPVARLLRPQGRRGELLADPLTDLAEFFLPGRDLWLAGPDAAAPRPDVLPVLLEASWQPQGRNAGRLVLKLRGVDSITAAEQLAGQELLLPASALPALAAGTYLVRDLVGCALWDGERLAGTVTGLEFPVAPDGRTRLQDAPDLLVVLPAQATGHPVSDKAIADEPEPVLVPFVQAWLEHVDLAAKRLTMHLPPGLFGTADPEDTPTYPPPFTCYLLLPASHADRHRHPLPGVLSRPVSLRRAGPCPPQRPPVGPSAQPPRLHHRPPPHRGRPSLRRRRRYGAQARTPLPLR